MSYFKIRDMLFHHLNGYRITQCLYVVATLNIAETLTEGPCSVRVLAEAQDVNEDALYRVLRYLGTLGIFEELPDQCFANTTLSQFLDERHPHSLKPSAILNGTVFYQGTGDLLYAVKTGKPGFDQHFNMDFWQYLQKNTQTSQAFNAAMQRGSSIVTPSIVSAYDFSAYADMVDVGGGRGHLLAYILQQYPTSKGAVFDLPSLKSECEQYLAERALSSRGCFIAGNFFLDSLPAADLYVLKVILHDFSDEQAMKILQNCKLNLKANGVILVIDRVIDSREMTDTDTYLWDVHMLAIHGGRERTEAEFMALIDRAGLALSDMISTDAGLRILVLRSPR